MTWAFPGKCFLGYADNISANYHPYLSQRNPPTYTRTLGSTWWWACSLANKTTISSSRSGSNNVSGNQQDTLQCTKNLSPLQSTKPIRLFHLKEPFAALILKIGAPPPSTKLDFLILSSFSADLSVLSYPSVDPWRSIMHIFDHPWLVRIHQGAHSIRPGLRGQVKKFHQQRWCTRRRQHAFRFCAVPFWNKLLTKKDTFEHWRSLLL